MSEFVPQWIIEKKRDGGALSEAEIREWIARYADGRLPDYQMAALAMAVYWRGMSADETLWLTDAMMRSGDVLSWRGLGRATADKHSTGGIGDKLSIPLAPLVAACGVAVPMISGRGLGITGGTLDKLESIPGYDTHLGNDRFREVVDKIGCSIIGQTDRLAPADRKLYALRDVTGTVPSIPLITASILSKKLAEGADVLVFDVKCGAGAFMKTRENARALADSLLAVARGAGRKAEALVTGMDQPVGRAAGNALEIAESVDILRGGGPADARELVLRLGEPMLVLGGAAPDAASARAAMEEKLASGAALETFARMVEAQGGDPRVADAPEKVLPQAPAVVDIPAPRGGVLARVDADGIGRVVLLLGGGRRAVTDTIDPSVGVSCLSKVGEEIEQGEPLLRIHARTRAEAEALVPQALAAHEIVDGPVAAPPLVL